MKKAVSICFVLFLASNLFGQKIKISIVPTISNLSFFKEDPIQNSRARFGAGLEADYLFISEKKIRFGLGVGIQNNHVRLFQTFGPSIGISNLRAIITSVKLESFYYINDQFYVCFIPAFDYHFKHPKEWFNDQTGLSLSFGLGNNIELKKSLSLCIEPRFTIFDIIPFKEKNVNYTLTTTGLRIGLIFGNKKD
jgi:hypothetical protein